MTHIFIINPAAGSRDRTADYSEVIRKVCKEKNLDYRIEVSAAPAATSVRVPSPPQA